MHTAHTALIVAAHHAHHTNLERQLGFKATTNEVMAVMVILIVLFVIGAGKKLFSTSS